MRHTTNNFSNKPQHRNQSRPASHDGFFSELPNFKAVILGFLIGVFSTSLVVFLLSPTAITLKIPSSSGSTLKPTGNITPIVLETPLIEPETQFDFYSELTKNISDNSVVVTKSDLKSAQKPINGYLVQAGIFKRNANADAIKAKLTLNGFNAKIEPVRLTDGEVRHRIVLGPFKTEQQAQAMQQKLKAMEVDSIVKAY